MRNFIHRKKIALGTGFCSIACMMMMGACDTVFDVHPYDVRVKGDTDLNAKNIRKIEESVKSKDTIRFAVISDSHQWLDDLQLAVNDINRRKDSIDFVIHCGDISDFGATKEMIWTRDKMQNLKMPSVVLLGNHDCLGTGNQSYATIFGDPDFSFIAGGVKFVCLNTNAMSTTTPVRCQTLTLWRRSVLAIR